MKIVLDLKVVMDTNVFVSDVFFSGPPYQILQAWQAGEFELVVSQEIWMSIAGSAISYPRNIHRLI